MEIRSLALLLVRCSFSRLLHLLRLLLRRRGCVGCALLMLYIIAFCSLFFRQPIMKQSSTVRTFTHTTSRTIRTTIIWKVQGVIAEALRRGDLVISPAQMSIAGLGNHMFSWASVWTLAARIAAHLPIKRKIVVVVPSNSKIFVIFGKQVC